MALTATTLLGSNTDPILRAIVDRLGRVGPELEVVAAPDLGEDMASAVEAVRGIDLVWACGLLTAELVAVGCPLEITSAPIFPGAGSSVYHSVFVARPATAEQLDGPLEIEDLKCLTFAVNELGSWSGYRAILQEFTAIRGEDAERVAAAISSNIVFSGAHVNSVAAVADGRADIAAIDHSIWDWLIASGSDAASGLVVADRTSDWPAPPFSIRSTSPGYVGLASALAAARDWDIPGLDGIAAASVSDYRFMLT